jgi:sterol desaturase/sphingolipid hydroxylase (fatty acid hydroxylase superfamily)
MPVTPTSTRRSEVLKASPKMFESDFLDFFTRVHPIVPVVLFGPAILLFAVLGVDGAGGWAAAWIAGGYLFWTLTEYWLHRVVFHFEPDHPVGRRFHFIIHGVHHDHPNDRLRLVMPPSASIPLAALFLLGFWAVLEPGAWQAFAAGFLGGYLAYDMLHFHVHHHKPTTRMGKKLRELHMRHHFQDGNRGFGVSAPWWDHVFGTAPRVRRRGGTS